MKLYQKITILSLALLGLSSTAYAVSDAELMKQGIWRDPKTGLYWDRCSVGQSWNGTTCTGEAIKLNWQDAQDYVKKFTNEQAKGGYTDWRLPTIEELSSIRYCSKGWKQDITTKKVSELTAQGRVERKVTTNHGTKMETIPANKGGTIQVPENCDYNSSEPTIDTTIFPNTKDRLYWSSSPPVSRSSHALGVWFDTGYIESYDKFYDSPSGFYVRSVRSD